MRLPNQERSHGRPEEAIAPPKKYFAPSPQKNYLVVTTEFLLDFNWHQKTNGLYFLIHK